MTYTPTADDMQTAARLAGWSTDEWRKWCTCDGYQPPASKTKERTDE